MARDRKTRVIRAEMPDRLMAQSVGTILLHLRNALRQAERCRLALSRLGYSRQRWQEIVNEVDPELRFMVRSKRLDAIIAYLRSEGEPVNRELLVKTLAAQGAGEPRRLRQSITANLRNHKLLLYDANKIGLPEWRTRLAKPKH